MWGNCNYNLKKINNKNKLPILKIIDSKMQILFWNYNGE